MIDPTHAWEWFGASADGWVRVGVAADSLRVGVDDRHSSQIPPPTLLSHARAIRHALDAERCARWRHVSSTSVSASSHDLPITGARIKATSPAAVTIIFHVSTKNKKRANQQIKNKQTMKVSICNCFGYSLSSRIQLTLKKPQPTRVSLLNSLLVWWTRPFCNSNRTENYSSCYHTGASYMSRLCI